ncbi:MAG: cysteine synthase family protein [Planctomycetota bacterium]|jgi:cysteine synthase A|nr:cysteine synthase family protein [Planctomycetota bacterium]MDP6941198.1 cysteine synthase family protein [Planctomycetota bacterium]
MNNIAALEKLIGNTPILQIRCRVEGKEFSIWAKQESINFTGSIKDRMALHIMRDAYAKGAVRAGDTLVEATSGNTGISFAAVGRALGHSVRIYMPDWMSMERVQVIQSLGAAVIPVSKEEGGFLGSIQKADSFAAETPGVFLPHQFDNEANIEAHYRGTGPEILSQMQAAEAIPTAFVAGVGTGGTVMGVGRFLREKLGEDFPSHPLEPANSPTMSTGCKVGKHRIQGISDEFVPSIVELDWLSDIVDVWDGDAILMAQKLAADLGLAVGISSGANFVGAVQIALQTGGDVATVFADSNKKYLSTDYCSDEEQKDHYTNGQVELLGFVAH